MAEYIEREALIAKYDRVHKGEAGGARKLMVDAPTAEGKYTIQFETGNYEYFEQVEKACRKVIGLRDKAVAKERCAQMRTVGHL